MRMNLKKMFSKNREQTEREKMYEVINKELKPSKDFGVAAIVGIAVTSSSFAGLGANDNDNKPSDRNLNYLIQQENREIQNRQYYDKYVAQNTTVKSTNSKKITSREILALRTKMLSKNKQNTNNLVNSI